MVFTDRKLCGILLTRNHNGLFGKDLPSVSWNVGVDEEGHTYQFSLSSKDRCFQRLIGEIYVKFLTDVCEIKILLLQKLRVFLEMFQKAVIGISSHLPKIEHYFHDTDARCTLMWSTHEDDTVSR